VRFGIILGEPLLLTSIIGTLYSTRLKNIEETEKAKRVVAEERQERKKTSNDEEHLAASRCTFQYNRIRVTELISVTVYRPDIKQKSDTDILRDAKLEAMGMLPPDDQPRRTYHERPQMATDELVHSNASSYYPFADMVCLRSWNASRRGCESSI
jgi:hypothetical protein